MKTLRSIIVVLIILLLSASAVGAQNPSAALRHVAPPGFMVGAAVQATMLEGDVLYAQTFTREYNTLVPENTMGFAAIHPQRDKFSFNATDKLVTFAENNGMQVRGSVSIWHGALPSWVTNGNFDRTQLIEVMRQHITGVMQHYQGRINVWNVVNEAVMSNGSLRDSIWSRVIGTDFIDIAFQIAHEVNPDAKLFYNDYGMEGLGAKSNVVYNLVKGMVERGIPIDGVGFQMHVKVDQYPSANDVAQNIQRLAELGLEIQITEMDVQIQTGSGPVQDRLTKQAEIYGDMLDVCLNNSACTGFITWGFTDRYTWLTNKTGTTEYPLPFDTNYQVKPAYTELLNELASVNTPPQQPPPPTPIPQPIPDHPAVVIDVQPNGNQIAVNFRLFKMQGLYGLEANCATDPNILGGLTRADGAGFNASNSFFIDQGFNAANGSWIVAASRLLPAEPIQGDMIAFSLGYTLKATGNPNLSCTMRAVDRNGRDLVVEVINGAMATTQPVNVLDEDLIQPPVESPVILVPAETQLSNVAGVVTYPNPTDNTGISVELMGGDYVVLASVITEANGAYQFTDVPAGGYYLRASAPGHLAVMKPILVDGNSPVVDLSTDTLIAGDTDNNGIVDLLDASFIGANFNLQAPPAPLEIDLNRDNLVNIGDLVLVGTNFGASTPGQ